VLRLRRYEQIFIENRRFARMGSVWPKISGTSGRPPIPTNHSSRRKTRMKVLSCGIRMWTQVSFVLSQRTRLTNRKALATRCFTLHHLHAVARYRDRAKVNHREATRVVRMTSAGNFICDRLLQTAAHGVLLLETLAQFCLAATIRLLPLLPVSTTLQY